MKREGLYRVRGEIGQYSFEVYDLESSKCVHDFAPQVGKTYRKSEGFRLRYLYEGCTQSSYRKIMYRYGKESFQSKASCSSRSFQDMVVRESKKVLDAFLVKSNSILEKYEVEVKSTKTNVGQSTIDQFEGWQYMDPLSLRAAFTEVKSTAPAWIVDHLLLDENAYECMHSSINISIDDICCKEQKNSRQGISVEQIAEKIKEKQRNQGRKNQKKRRFLYHNVTHFEYANKQYQLVGERLSKQLPLIYAFLLANGGLKNNWIFFVDGQRTINECIEHRFSFKQIDMILDWYHLDKKIQKQMFHSLKRCDERDEILSRTKKLLWYGLVDSCLEYLAQIDEQLIKNEKELELFKSYLERNRRYIKCYAMRKALGLRLSSNRVEKVNDLVIADRQKNNGMSFTRPGSSALALMKNIMLNGEQKDWISSQQIRFSFSEAA